MAWGVIVALAAYVSATGSPNLSVQLTFQFSHPNEPVFVMNEEVDSDATHRVVKTFKQTQGTVTIINASKYSARNPGVRIGVHGLGGMRAQPGWEILTIANMIGPVVFQWDGGADYIVHGNWSRTLPELDVKGMFTSKVDPAFIIDIAADGFGPKRTRIPVRVLNEVEFDIFSEDRRRMNSREVGPASGPKTLRMISRLRSSTRPRF